MHSDTCPSLSSIGDDLLGTFRKQLATLTAITDVPRGLAWGVPGSRQRMWLDGPHVVGTEMPVTMRVNVLTEIAALKKPPRAWRRGTRQRLLDLSAWCLEGGFVRAPAMDGHLAFASALTLFEDTTPQTAQTWAFQLLTGSSASVRMLRDDESWREPFKEGAPETNAPLVLSEAFVGALEELSERRGDLSAEIDADLAAVDSFLAVSPVLATWKGDDMFEAEVPFGKDTAALEINRRVVHPVAGECMRVDILLPITPRSEDHLLEMILDFNLVDFEWMRSLPMRGSWCGVESGGSSYLGHRTWIPCPMFNCDSVSHAVAVACTRINHHSIRLFDTSIMEAYPAACRAHGIVPRVQAP